MPPLELPPPLAYFVADSKTATPSTRPTATPPVSTSSSSSAAPSLAQRLEHARDTRTLEDLTGEDLQRESQARSRVFRERAASLTPQGLTQAFQQAGVGQLSKGDSPASQRLGLKLVLWELMELASRMTPVQRQTELAHLKDITQLQHARSVPQTLNLLRLRFIALYAALDISSRHKDLETAKDPFSLQEMSAEDRGFALQIRAEQFRAQGFLCTPEESMRELAQLRRPLVMLNMDSQLLDCEADLRHAQFKGHYYYLTEDQRSAEVRKALDMSVLRKAHEMVWQRTVQLRECEFAAFAYAMGEQEGMAALKAALIPENLGTTQEAAQERTLLLRSKLLHGLMHHFESDDVALNRAHAILKDPTPLCGMSSQRLGHALRLRKEAFEQWLQAQPFDQRGTLARQELVEAFSLDIMTRLTIPLQATVGMLRLALASIAVLYL